MEILGGKWVAIKKLQKKKVLNKSLKDPDFGPKKALFWSKKSRIKKKFQIYNKSTVMCKSYSVL